MPRVEPVTAQDTILMNDAVAAYFFRRVDSTMLLLDDAV